MKKKVFSLMMTLLLAFVGVVKADVVEIGVGGTSTNSYLPNYEFYNYSLTQQIYTAGEIGTAGTINSIAFYYTGTATRTLDIYMVNSTVSSFTSNNDWIAVTAADKVYSGSVTYTANAWNTFVLDTPFEYDGLNNLVVIVDDNTGSYVSSIGAYVFDATGMSLRNYNDYTDYNPLSPELGSGAVLNVKNQIQLDITPATGGGTTPTPVAGEQIFAVQNGEVVETVEVGARPNGYWMEPFTFQIRNTGDATTITHLDWTPDDYFTLVAPELPILIAEEDVNVQLATGVTENTDWQMVAIYGNGRTAAVWNISAEPYDAAMPDVWELACEEATTFPFVEVPATDHDATLYDNYNLPFPEIAEGYDAVYKLVFDNDVVLNAEVTSGANGKVALYTEDFNGEGGPMADNNYNGPLNAAGGGSAAGAPFEAQIGEGTSTTGYMPFYCYYNYSMSQQLFLATELAEAGVTVAPMTSLSWYCTSTNGNTQSNITIWMANVDDTEISSNSIMTSGMTKVFFGECTPAANEWNEFVFNQGTFAWDGQSNVLVSVQRNNGDWASGINWQCGEQTFTAGGYSYNDNSGAYDMETNSYYFGSDYTTYVYGGTSTSRANIIMKASARATAPVATTAEISYGPVITDAPVAAGTYYLVASSTDQDFEVTINAEDMPCPTVDGFAFNPIPADDEDEIEPASVLLQWMNPANATSYQVFFGSTYYPEPGHMNTQISDVLPVTGEAGSFRVNGLWNNTNYFWYVVFYNDGACQDGVESPHWGFTTHLNVPQNLQVSDESIFDDETVTLTWSSVVDRTYRTYFIYRDGEKVGETTMNDINHTTFTDGPLAYNMNGYVYYVTAIYDEGESAPSNTVNVKVSGYGDVNGHVYDMDGVTGIANATVTIEGTDEFGDPHTYTYTTDENGYYEGHPYAGSYDGSAACNGYQGIDAPVQGNPIAIAYNNTTSPIDYVMDENFTPVCQVIAEYYPDSLDPNSPYVKVYWGCGLPGSDIIEDFETGDFSQFDWQLGSPYPWVITTQNPYEGTYCMKSGNQQVLSSTSTMQVTVDIPADGIMSFFGKISCESGYDNGYFYIDGVQRGTYTGESNWVERTFDITAGSHTFKWEYTEDYMISSGDDCFYVDYINFYRQPEPAMPGMTYDFENSTMQGWSSVDADGDGYGWYVASEIMSTGYGHNSSNDCVLSQSYSNSVGVLYPDNYLVSPQVALGGTLRFYACAQDASYAAEHFGVAVSTTNTNPSSFTTIQEWTMSAKSAPAGGRPAKNSRSGRAQGTWYEYTVDLSAYSGNGYVAIRHFNCSDMFYLDVDDITIGEPGAKSVAETRTFDHYRIYRTNCYNDGPYTEENTVLLATNWPGDTVYIDVEWADLEPGVYKWGVGVVYSGNHRGEEIQSEITWSEPINVNPDMANRDQTIDFEDGQIPSGWNNDATYPWTVVNNAYAGYNGTYCIKSGNGGVASSTSGIETTVDYSDAGTVSFLGGCWGEGSATIWDKCKFYIDGTEQMSYGALQSWNTYTFNVTAGSHTFRWSYEKDSSVNPTGDAFFVDDVTFTVGTGGGGGNTGGNYGPGGEPIQLDRESVIVWSNCLDKDMYLDNVTVTVLLNSADSPDGTTVNFTNLNEYEQQNYAIAPLTLDESGFYAFESFRRGDYAIKVEKEGYETIFDTVSIWNNMDLRYVMIEILYGIGDVYVSRTGWAMWEDNHNNIGSGAKNADETMHFEYYKVLCTSIDGVPIYNHNTIYPFCQLSYNEPYNAPLVSGEHYLCKVAAVYSTGISAWSEPVEWEYESCESWGPVDEVTATTVSQGNLVEWVFDHGFNPYDPGTGGGGGGQPGAGDWYYYDNGVNEDAIGTNGGNFYWGVMFPAGSYTGNMVTKVKAYDYMAMTGNVTIYQGGATAPGTAVGQTNVTFTGSEDFVEFEFASPVTIDPTQNVWVVFYNGSGATYPASVCANTGDANGRWVSLDGTTWEDLAGYDLDYTFMVRAYIAQGAKGEVKEIKVNAPVAQNNGTLAISGNGPRVKNGVNFAKGGSFYTQYAEDGIMLNFYALDNVDFRAFMLYTLSNDNRFSLVADEEYGQFILTSLTNSSDFINEFENVYQNAIADFSLVSKVDIADHLLDTWKTGVNPTNLVSIMMDVMTSNNRPENDHCINSLPFCTSEMITFQAANTSNTANEPNMDDGCIGSSYNPSFYHMRIHTAGPFVIHMEGHDPDNGTNRDIDFCMWGPYTEQEVTSGTACSSLTGDKIMDCNYSASYSEDCYLGYPEGQHQHSVSHGTVNYHMPEVGEYYILMITNYSQQPCVISFTKTEGEGETDCNIVINTDILGFLITEDGEYVAFAGPDDRDYLVEGEYGDHEYCVRPIYPGDMILPSQNYGWSMGCPVCATISDACNPGAPIHGELTDTDQVKVWWGDQNPGPGGCEGDEFSVDFETGLPAGWTTIDADGDGDNWMLGSTAMGAGYGHNGSGDLMLSRSYDNNSGPLTPDNWLVTPAVTLCENSTFSFYACAQDASYAAEHFGVAVSEDGGNTFTMVQEWTMTAKGEGKAGGVSRSGRAQGNWYQYTVDLGAYAGEGRKVAIRHFNCTDWFYLDVDDIQLSAGAKNVRAAIESYNVYRSTDNANYTVIGNVPAVAGQTYYEYIDTPAAGTYYYQVTAVYADCESEPAQSAVNPTLNYVMVEVGGDNVGENNGMAIFPNPTKGNVTIQANGMRHITVVSVLGQVVYDTDVNTNEVILNMSQFNAGMYTVRVVSENGVHVERITVVR